MHAINTTDDYDTNVHGNSRIKHDVKTANLLRISLVKRPQGEPCRCHDQHQEPVCEFSRWHLSLPLANLKIPIRRFPEIGNPKWML